MKEVVKYNGEKALLKNCRKIKNEYYEKNVDCFLVDDKWNRVDNGLIFYDYVSHRWLRKANYNLVEGFVNESKIKYLIIVDENVIKVKFDFYLNEEVAKLHNLVESINSEEYVPVGTIQKKAINAKYGNLRYNITKNDIAKLSERYQNLFKSNYSNGILSKFLSDYTFGLEFETSNGYIRKSKLNEHGVIPLLDGSLRKPDGTEPFEFTTIPYSGVKGIETIKSFCNVLDLHCEYDHSCSLHIHVGGLGSLNKFQTIAFYKFLSDIQSDVFKMFPLYKYNPEYIGKSKNYCKMLPYINFQSEDIASSEIFTFLTNRYLDEQNNFQKGEHLFEGVSKWNIHSRYHWVNLIPLLFNTRRTVEFRIHEPTFNGNLVTNWLLIIITILNYFKNNYSHIMENSIKFTDVLKSSIYGKSLLEYYEDRVAFYKNCNNLKEYYEFYDKDYRII